MYHILSEISENTLLALSESRLFVMKKIHPQDAEIYRKLSTLDCRRVAKVEQLTTVGDSLYAVLSYVQGDTLESYVKKNGALSDDETKRLAVQICLGLKEIHSLGIVHRDINPHNIIIDDYRNAVIIDFDISRTYKNESSSDTQILGTQGYAAPEQFGFSQTNCRSDIYSVGVLINFMKTGKLPNEQAAGGAFAPIIKKCTEIDEFNRYENMDALLNALDSAKFRHKMSIINLIPGFRRGIRWHQITAVSYYLCVLFSVIALISGEITRPFLVWLTDALTVIIVSLGVPFIFFDAGNWCERFFRKRRVKKGEIIFAKCAFSYLCVMAAALIMYVVTLIYPQQV